MDDRKCWEMKPNCMMNGRNKEKSNCPAFRESIGCWEVDWKKIVESLPASQQEYWYMFMEKCPSCTAYKAHPDEMQARIDAVKVLYLSD